jgi:hypothetical protein
MSRLRTQVNSNVRRTRWQPAIAVKCWTKGAIAGKARSPEGTRANARSAGTTPYLTGCAAARLSAARLPKCKKWKFSTTTRFLFEETRPARSHSPSNSHVPPIPHSIARHSRRGCSVFPSAHAKIQSPSAFTRWLPVAFCPQCVIPPQTFGGVRTGREGIFPPVLRIRTENCSGLSPIANFLFSI